MNRTQLALLIDCAMATHFKPGQIIFHEGEPVNRFYLLETGKVMLESGEGFGKPVVVETIGAGDLLGWSWMFPPVRLAFHRTRGRAHGSDLLLRHDPPRMGT